VGRILLAFVLLMAGGCRPEDHCDGNVLVICGTDKRAPRSCTRTDCGSQYCVEAEPGLGFEAAFCAPDPEPTPACLDEALHAGASGYATCVGAERYHCSGGYRRASRSCGSPELCHVANDVAGHRHVHCILSATQDPRCLPLPDRTYQSGIMPLCDGALALACFDGYLTSMEDCAATGSRCESGYCR
jgi:hypothetical protein